LQFLKIHSLRKLIAAETFGQYVHNMCATSTFKNRLQCTASELSYSSPLVTIMANHFFPYQYFFNRKCCQMLRWPSIKFIEFVSYMKSSVIKQ
jgi:hypothetical protein